MRASATSSPARLRSSRRPADATVLLQKRDRKEPWMSLPTRRWALAAFAAAAISTPALAAPLSPADQALVAKAQAYLQGLASVKGRFVQTDPRGSTSSGDLYIRRPGKARFAYDPP